MSWEQLKLTVRGLFGMGPSVISEVELSYQDPENDQVVLSNEEEWRECIHLHSTSDGHPLRICVKPRKEKHQKGHPKEGEGQGFPKVEASHFYTTGNRVIPNEALLEGIQGVVTKLMERFLAVEDGVPEWLQPVLKRSSDGLVDVDVDCLGHILHHRAVALMDQGDLETALELYQSAARLPGPSSIYVYNAACCQALLNRPEEAIHSLHEAIEMGYCNVGHMLGDSDLISLREHPEFATVVGAMMERNTNVSEMSTAPSPPPTTTEEPEATVLTTTTSATTSPKDGEDRSDSPKETEATPQTEEAEPTAVMATEAVDHTWIAPAAPTQAVIEEVVRDERMEKFGDQLKRMEMMGFVDVERVLRALEASNGSMAEAIESLLSE